MPDLRQQTPQPVGDADCFAGQVVVEPDDQLRLGDGLVFALDRAERGWHDTGRAGDDDGIAGTSAGKKAFDKQLPNSEPQLREVFSELKAERGTVLVVVDRCASIGALPPAVAGDMGSPVAYLPRLTMRPSAVA